MNIKITSLKSKPNKMREFNRKEWKLVHPEHFGSKQNINYWTKKKFAYKAEVDGKIAGTLNGNYMAGVMYLSQLIIAGGKRGLGIGKKLMDKAEKLAKDVRLHKIYLHTGSNWKAVKFYEKLGYIKETKLKNHYEHQDFWIMSKELK